MPHEEAGGVRHDEVRVAGRSCGPPGTGNGGHVCGTVATALPGRGPVEVTLQAPTPLDRPLRLEVDGDEARLHHAIALDHARRAALLGR